MGKIWRFMACVARILSATISPLWLHQCLRIFLSTTFAHLGILYKYSALPCYFAEDTFSTLSMQTKSTGNEWRHFSSNGWMPPRFLAKYVLRTIYIVATKLFRLHSAGTHYQSKNASLFALELRIYGFWGRRWWWWLHSHLETTSTLRIYINIAI